MCALADVVTRHELESCNMWLQTLSGIVSQMVGYCSVAFLFGFRVIAFRTEISHLAICTPGVLRPKDHTISGFWAILMPRVPPPPKPNHTKKNTTHGTSVCGMASPLSLVLLLIIVNPRKLEHGFRTISAGILSILYLKRMRITMFHLSGFYFNLSTQKEPTAQERGNPCCSSPEVAKLHHPMSKYQQL